MRHAPQPRVLRIDILDLKLEHDAAAGHARRDRRSGNLLEIVNRPDRADSRLRLKFHIPGPSAWLQPEHLVVERAETINVAREHARVSQLGHDGVVQPSGDELLDCASGIVAAHQAVSSLAQFMRAGAGGASRGSHSQ